MFFFWGRMPPNLPTRVPLWLWAKPPMSSNPRNVPGQGSQINTEKNRKVNSLLRLSLHCCNNVIKAVSMTQLYLGDIFIQTILFKTMSFCSISPFHQFPAKKTHTIRPQCSKKPTQPCQTQTYLEALQYLVVEFYNPSWVEMSYCRQLKELISLKGI